ncbi:D-alanyl-D-alanine carboxypeptidase/D-alanyl-D-alanine-endopeptidase [Leptolyngbya sp. PCC 6406]|uniref:D-alanyl-D-alanine carboxypeptidase/D-alanyl-D-alanine endopeptidase n=1 Tax=Leptolyngbya sp. PCC 6406 TaxID=1173264 RepID=UPI000685AF29|nr:D-alanyl-D-alanine carboxypeptidase/D-alanyl-D-alanine-endopeptidase [Leptolyngbya sp. PCC 6406]
MAWQQHFSTWGQGFTVAIGAVMMVAVGSGANATLESASSADPSLEIVAVSATGTGMVNDRPNGAIAQAAPSPTLCPPDLSATLNTIVSQPRFATAQWGIVVEPLTDTSPLYSHNAETLMIPASNIKLLTTAAALRIVGSRSPQDLNQLRQWIDPVNRNSDNRAADALLRRIGGQHAVRQALLPLGIDPEGYQQVDGSGLSRQNRMRPATLVTLLKAMAAHEDTGLFYASLPVGGVSGTLRNRFRDSPLQGRVRAKTGTLQGVRALSGYVQNGDYGEIAFSLVINQPGQTGTVMVQTIDQMVLHISQVQRC